MWIAEEGVFADPPQDWITDQSNPDEIMYVNMRTGERTCEHPCDVYYQQLVIQ